MLYDPKWETTITKPDVFSLEGLIAWLEKQPTETQYDWRCVRGGCLIGLYAAATNISLASCHTAFFHRGDLHVASTEPYTFGAALERAREAVSA